MTFTITGPETFEQHETEVMDALVQQEQDLLNFEAEAAAPADEQVWTDGELVFVMLVA